MDVIAAVSVVTSGIVGLGGLATPALLERRTDARVTRQTRDIRLDELRSVIDDATRAAIAILEVAPQLEDVVAGSDAVAGVVPRLRKGLYDVMAQEARIASRVGAEDELVRTYRALHQTLGALHVYWSHYLQARHEEQDLRDLMNDIYAAQAVFYNLSSARVGPDRDAGRVSGA